VYVSGIEKTFPGETCRAYIETAFFFLNPNTALAHFLFSDMQSYLPSVMHCMFLVSRLMPTNAASLPSVFPRGDTPAWVIPPEWLDPGPPPGIEESYAMVEFHDGPTDDGVAGIGAEFETTEIQFIQPTCNLADTFKAKRKVVVGHAGKNFELSVDTSVEQGQGKLSAEYVLDGRRIKVGQDMAAAAGRAAHDDLVSTILDGLKPGSN
jgi:hypothetical protein